MIQERRKRLKLEGSQSKIIEEEYKKPKSFSKSSIGTEVGFSVVVPIVGGVFLGVYLDKKFGLSPRLTLSFLFLGVMVGFINIFRIVSQNKD